MQRRWALGKNVFGLVARIEVDPGVASVEVSSNSKGVARNPRFAYLKRNKNSGLR